MRRWSPFLLLASLLIVLAAGCSDEKADLSEPVEGSAVGEVPVYDVEVVETVPHDASTYTQGLLLDEEGRMFESGGLQGASKIQEVDPASGEVLRMQPVPEVFAEGLALAEDELVQITWKDGQAFVYDPETFEVVDEHAYEGEGWGLCHDGERFVMSDGSNKLTFRDTETFEETGDVTVKLDGAGVDEINELECANGNVYANIWHSDRIVEIDPETGDVTGVIEAGGLLDPPMGGEAVLNGIAFDPESETFWLTGKNWPTLFRVEFVERTS